jgi:hypothetical protein
MLASHTLIAYPVASRLGLSKNRAVTATLGATIVTDTLALLVLAVVASSHEGELSSDYWLRLSVSMGIYIAGIFILVPQLARWFFRRVRPDGPSEFMFVLATVFTCAGLSHGAGLEPIVGAFLAGLALNRSIPHESPLMNRIVFTGDALFIPFFLLSVGMLLDVRIFAAGLRSWLVSVAMVGCVIAGKYLATRLARAVFGYNRAEANVMFGLSLAQAAATLAAVMVGYRIGLLDDTVLNGAILMMLITCIWAPMLVDRHGRALALAEERAPADADSRPQRILVSLSNAETAPPLVDLALVLRDGGQQQPVYPLTVVRDGGDNLESVAYAERMLSHAVLRCTSADVPSQPVTRIDVNVAAALRRARRELRISDIVMGWSDEPSAQDRVFGSFLEHLLEERDCALWMARARHPLNTTRRVVFAVPPHAVREAGFPAAAGAVKLVASRLGASLAAWAISADQEELGRHLEAASPTLEHQTRGLASWSLVAPALADDRVSDLDLLILYGARPGALAFSPGTDRVSRRIAARFPAANFLIVYPGEPAAATDVQFRAVRARIPRFLREESIVFGLGGMTFADGVVTALEEGLARRGLTTPSGAVLAELFASETELIGGVVLLHAGAEVDEAVVLVGASREGLDRHGASPAHLLFIVLKPPGESPQTHLDRLADIARLAGAPGVKDRVSAATSPAELLVAMAPPVGSHEGDGETESPGAKTPSSS